MLNNILIIFFILIFKYNYCEIFNETIYFHLLPERITYTAVTTTKFKKNIANVRYFKNFPFFFTSNYHSTFLLIN